MIICYHGYQQNAWENQRKVKDNILRQFLTSWKQMKELQTTEVITSKLDNVMMCHY